MVKRFFFISIFFLLISYAYSVESGYGIISALEGEAQKRSVNSSDWLEAKLKMDVKSKDIVRTLPDSFAEILLSKGSVLRLAPKTTVNMVKLYEESKNKKVTKVKVEEGEVWGNINKQNEDEVFDVDATAVSSSIVGTIFRINTGDDGTLIKVYKGQVEVKANKKKHKKSSLEVHEVEGPHEISLEEWTVVVHEMMQLRVDKNGNIVRMDKINLNSKEEKNRWAEWNRKRDKLSKVKH